MTRAISRDSHQELKDYLGVQFQQGRPILDADLNEAQSILLSQLRRLGAAAVGEGSTDDGFVVVPARWASPEDLAGSLWDRSLETWFGPTRFFLSVPGDLLDDFESDEFTKSSPQGTLRVARDRPYQGSGFLRLSGHAGTVTVSRTLDEPRDLSAYEVATFRYRLNHRVPGSIRFFFEDVDGNRTVWPCANLTPAPDTWLAAFAAPLDLSFRILRTELGQVEVGSSRFWTLSTYGRTGPVSWEFVGDPPDGLVLADTTLGRASLQFKQPLLALGRISLTLQATDDATGRVATRELFVDIVEPPKATTWADFDVDSGWEFLERPETPTGTPADLTAVQRYGFELFQDVDTPLVWDLDDLRLGSSALRDELAENDFVIQGSRDNDIRAQLAMTGALVAARRAGVPQILVLDYEYALPILESQLSGEPGHFYVAGLPCVQDADVRYSHQADPNDPPLTAPPAGQRRVDTVYLDAWTEAVTFVQDPAIREVALGGIDTSTRERVRYRIRVAQGAGVPDGDGRGLGALTTEGTYTAAANRLYRVEIDRPGDIGEATFRWSNENASVVARIIEPVPPGSTTVVVEDAGAFHPGDLVLLSKEFGAERHEVQQVLGNMITLATPTGGQLAALPAGGRPGFTTFAMADRPMVQRWDGFGVAITPDPDDETVSTSIPLEDGVRVRFGGSRMLAGDHWMFTARYLAGDDAGGVDPLTRIERLNFTRPHGVRHHYAPLAELIREAAADQPSKIGRARDRRRASGRGPRSATGTLSDTEITGTARVHLGGLRLPGYSPGGTFLATWSGDVVRSVDAAATPTSRKEIEMEVVFYDDDMTDPQVDETRGRLELHSFGFSFKDRPIGERALFSHTALSNGRPRFYQPDAPISPASVQVFAQYIGPVATIGLSQMRLSIIELPSHH